MGALDNNRVIHILTADMRYVVCVVLCVCVRVSVYVCMSKPSSFCEKVMHVI